MRFVSPSTAFVAALGVVLVLLAAGLASCGDDSGPGAPKTPSGTAARTPAATAGTAAPTRPAGGGAGASQTGATLSIAPVSAGVGAEAVVELRALGVSGPGLGAWTLQVDYDGGVLSVASCAVTSEALSVCNPSAGPGAVRVAGASPTGLRGDVTLAAITFRCQSAGSSSLEITAETLADATVGDPREIDETVEAGELTCG